MQTDRLTILCGDALEQLRTLPDESVQTCVTSPPYWGLRDYGVAGQIGLERTPQEFTGKMVEVFREVRRVLKQDGTAWVNLGDSYTSGGRKERDPGQSKIHPAFEGDAFADDLRPDTPPGLKPKDLIGIPWRVAFALQDDGWYLRCDIVWSKPNPMPESVTDRPTRAHEFIFLLSKRERYYYDAAAIREDNTPDMLRRAEAGHTRGANGKLDAGRHDASTMRGPQTMAIEANGRNKRSVWTVATEPYPEAHFATYPAKLIKPCILAGSRAGDVVLDPFAGSGTTGQVALELGRKAVLIELNPEYVKLIERRCDVTPGLAL